jgi:hypothetical protein
VDLALAAHDRSAPKASFVSTAQLSYIISLYSRWMHRARLFNPAAAAFAIAF